MKIGILTFHRAYNYGAFLQAFALKSYLEDLGHDVCFIDYWPYYHERAYRIWDENEGVRSFLRNLLLAVKRQIRFNSFKKLQRRYLGLTEKPLFRMAHELEKLDFDLVIYGSDQIWWKSRIGMEGFDDVYWGRHISSTSKKITYAASMGIIDLTDNEKLSISDYLKNFSDISVREVSLKDAIQPLTDRKISLALDPTLLVHSSLWQSMCKDIAPFKGKYVLYYKMMICDKADVFAKEIGRKLHLPVITVYGGIDSYKARGINVSPIRFVSLIRDAECVVSTSFHGVAMSIQFKKEFFAMGMNNNSDRVSTLLSLLGLESRMTENVPSGSLPIINYDDVFSRLERLREESENYLIQSLHI